MKLKRYIQRVWSKNSIAFKLFEKITEYTPNHKDLTFVDLLWWWWAMSSNATYFFKDVIYNEIDKSICDLFVAVQDDNFIKGLKERWISREEFNKIKNKPTRTLEEEIILTTFSFGNNRTTYIYWKLIEKKKEITHKIVFSKTEEEYKKLIKEYNKNKLAHFEKYWAIWECFLIDDDWKEFIKADNRRYYKFWKRADYYRKFYKWFDMKLFIEKRWKYINKLDIKLLNDLKKIYNLSDLERLERLESLERLKNLERLERLESLQRLERLERLEIINICNLSYDEVKLPNNNDCIIYLDPPYRNTMQYEYKFDFNKFDNFVLNLKNKWYKIFVSEYNLPYWQIIFEKTKRWFKSQEKDNYTWTEKLYLI